MFVHIHEHNKEPSRRKSFYFRQTKSCCRLENSITESLSSVSFPSEVFTKLFNLWVFFCYIFFSARKGRSPESGWDTIALQSQRARKAAAASLKFSPSFINVVDGLYLAHAVMQNMPVKYFGSGTKRDGWIFTAAYKAGLAS